MFVLLFDVFNRYSLVKKWIGKQMSNIYYWEKLIFSKLVWEVNFSEKNLKKWAGFEEQKGTKYTHGNFYFGIWHCLQLSFVYKTVSQIYFNLFCLGDERLLSELGNEVDFRYIHNEHFPKYLG